MTRLLQSSRDPRRPLTLLLLGCLVLLSHLLIPSPALAQEEVIPILRGRVEAGGEPVRQGMVVLHQVSAESAGEIDSVTVGDDGSFRLTLPHVPDHATRPDIFFASIRHQGLLYFGPAITQAVQLDSLYLIQAYDTMSVPEGGAELPLTVRNLFLEETEDGWAATDLIQVRHSGNRTLYSPEEGVIWSYPFPPSASNFEPGQTDMGPEEVTFTGGRMEVYTPLAPGERYFLVRYDISESEFQVPLPGQTDLLEILVREPGPNVEFPPLRRAEPVELEPGNVYRRYVAENLQDTVIQATLAAEPWDFPAEWLAILLAGLLGGAGVYAYRYRSGMRERAVERGAAPTREDLLVAVAELDEAFQAKGDESSEARREYERRRTELLARIRGLS